MCKGGKDFVAASLLIMIAGNGGVVEKNKKDGILHTVHDDDREGQQPDSLARGSCSEPETSRLPTWSSTAVMTTSPPHFNNIGLIRSVSVAPDADDTSDGEDTMTTEETDDDRSSSSSSSSMEKVKGVTFNESVRVVPIPPLSHYTLEQRRNMYANRFEVRENKLRNKKEYAFDNYDWKNCTEECSMVICPMSGNLLHPAHF